MDLKLRKKILWERSGNFNLSPYIREESIKEYLYLSKPIMDIELFFGLNEYKGIINNNGEKFRLKNQNEAMVNDVVYIISKEKDQCILESYRLIGENEYE